MGSLIGRTLGKPLGAVATTIDETFQTAGDVARANPRYQHRPNEPKQLAAVSISPADEAYYYQAEVLVKTQGPARIESLSLQQAEDVSEFWR